MNRTHRLRSLLVGAAMAMALTPGVHGSARERPHIVLIEVDDLTYTYAGAFGSKTAITPNIDRLANEVKSADDAIETQRAYHGAVHFVDRQVGRVLEALTRKGILEETVIVFFSDHGIFMGAHGLTHKGTLFRQVTNPSLIIRGPEALLHGEQQTQAVELTDLLPTLLELAGAPATERSPHGASLVPLLTGTGRANRTHAFAEIRDWVVVADDHYRPIRNLKDGSVLLFDEIAAPENLTNIADRHPDTVRAMSVAIDEWIKTTGDPLPPKSF